MKAVSILIFLLGFKAVYAHNPDLASLMIYEQNGKSILLINSSLTAFEAEVEYNFGKDAYKTPEEFNQLVIQLFRKNCFVIANGDTIKVANLQIQLGHETTLFAELTNVPNKIKTLYVSCALFKDMSENRCELILTDIRGLPQKQYVFNNNNQHQVAFRIENDKWFIDNVAEPFYLTQGFLIGSAILLVALIIIFFTKKRQLQF